MPSEILKKSSLAVRLMIEMSKFITLLYFNVHSIMADKNL